MKKVLILFGIFILFSLNFVSAECAGGVTVGNNISQYGITWTFDKPYQCGQFVNGDYWVVGPVTVQSVNPPPTGSGSSFRNGSMVNPRTGLDSKQGYHGNTYDFDASTSTSFPLDLSAGQSLLSSISNADDFRLPNGVYLPIKVIAIITCLDSNPGVDAFRPQYSTGAKTIYHSTGLLTNLLPNLTPASNPPSLESVAAVFEKPWVDHFWEYPGGTLHPHLNFPECTYGRDSTMQVGRAALMLCSDSAVIGDKTILLNRIVKLGIDNYGLVLAGQKWSSQGGHPIGRKLPILIAGLMLNDSEMFGVGTSYPPDSITFGEDHQIAHITQSMIDAIQQPEVSGIVQGATANTVILQEAAYPQSLNDIQKDNEIEIISGRGLGQRRTFLSFNANTKTGTLKTNWDIIPDGTSRYHVIGYESNMLGVAEWGSNLRATGGVQANPSWYAGYRTLVGYTLNGEALAAFMLGLKSAWNNDAFFDYTDRYMNVTAPNGTYPGYRSIDAWTERMWDTYRNCSNGIQDGTETGVDCGGICPDVCEAMTQCTITKAYWKLI